MKIIDDKNKKLTIFTRNYFFIATLLVVAINIFLFAFLGSKWETTLFNENRSTYNFMNALFGSLSHADWEHVLLNMLCFFVCGLYLERKIGSIKFFILVFIICFISRMAIVTISLSVSGHGFSSANYAIYGIVIVNYFSALVKSFVKKEKNLFNNIFGAIVIGLMILAFCYEGGNSFPFTYYPKDLLRSVHWPGFVVGLMFGVILQIDWKNRKQINQ